MNKTERMRYAKAILLAQDKIALVYFRMKKIVGSKIKSRLFIFAKFRAELKK